INTHQENCIHVFILGEMTSSTLQILSGQHSQHQTQRSHALSVEEQCLIALRFYACGTFYQVIGDNMGVRKTTVSNVVKAMSVALGSLINQFVYFPKDDQTAQTKHKFLQMGNMPSTIGAIDCTHYVNRKGRHSIDIQLVGNADLIITNCVVKWPGSVHDARILRENSAYPLLPWLMTPFPVPNTPEESRFNSSHCKTRCAIERLNGVLKRRFACLNYLRVQPKVECNIILACNVLHNICNKNKDLGDGKPAQFSENCQPSKMTPYADLLCFFIIIITKNNNCS
uniref:Putative nuclease HARBI1 n=1 Tax=Paramormyrops kingsleyae TaxID=1676925 RepID=A0A3B3S7Y3_9TELE